ncbi:CheF family chemotaxis protein [Halorussus amylolyticus]|uniref:CheF family chemotaxis protein n=1 Tax=Halorussus amylolyticus TaxID=1126242 RepID=UPI001052FD5F|nr:CheF family chemotaxis protein [Halorussus amylolyticus]
MSEKVIADFVARFTVETFETPDPVSGRIVLSRRRLVLATSDSKTTIPLSAIFDINVGQVPGDLDEFFQDTITIAYEVDGTRRVAVIEAGTEEVTRFKTVLFKAQLSGSQTRIKHPARVGGRVTDSTFRPAKLRIRPGVVRFVCSDPVTVNLANVTYFEKARREVGTVVAVRHADEGQSVTSEFALENDRKLNLLGRYLRLEYSELAQAAEEVDVSEGEVEALVAIYSGGRSGDLAGMLGVDSSRVTMLLNDLREKGLVDEGQKGLSLTAQGQLLVSDRIETVNT